MREDNVIAPSMEMTEALSWGAMWSTKSQLLLNSAGNYKWKNVLHSVQR